MKYGSSHEYAALKVLMGTCHAVIENLQPVK